MDAAGLVARARQNAGLSMRALSARAGVAYTTVSRIEHGLLDPTTGMLQRLLQAAGEDLQLDSCRAQVPGLADLFDAWHRDARGQDRPDWPRLRAFTDHLRRFPQQVGPATLMAPAASGSAFVDNLLAAIAEKLSDDHGIPRPDWTRRTRALREPWVTPGTAAMQAEARRSTPSQFLARNIVLSEDSLWRPERRATA